METEARIRARKKYYKTHKKIISDKAKKYRETHKEQIATRMKEYYKTHKRNRNWEKTHGKTQGKTWRLNNPEKYAVAKKRAVLKKYGLTEETKNDLRVSQGGLCAICKNKLHGKGNEVIDHSHSTGKTRGLLCQSCNKILGFSKDNILILRSAIEYLERS